jgi:RND family efflux transporter MFP subunit
MALPRTFHPWVVALLACLSGQAEAAESGDFDVRAQLTPRQTTILSSEIAGKVLELPVREGQAFREGQEIVALDCASYRARLAQAEAQVSRARRRASALRILDGRGATGRADLDIAVIEVEAARAEQQLASIDVSRCSIAAPFSGRVAELKLQRFEYVTAGQPVIEILSDQDLEVELLAPSRWLGWLSPGTIFTVQVDELGRGFPAVVTRIGARIDPVSQSVKIYARIDGHFPELVPGMSGLAHLKPPMDASVRQ